MRLLQPWWLVLLGPWVGLVILALREYRPKVLVPYLDLWPREEMQEKDKRKGWRPPAWPVILLLLAMLLGIAGLARPVWESRRPTLKHVTIIVDRGVTMLAGERGRQAADRAVEILGPLLAEDGQIRVVDTLGGDQLIPRGQLSDALHSPAVAVDVRERVKALCAAAEGPTLLLSDLADAPAGVVQVAPQGAIRDVGIVRAAVAEGQCLLEVRNDTELGEVEAVISGRSQRLELPLRGRGRGRGQTRQYLLPVSGDDVHVQLNVSDDLADDNQWWILGSNTRPKLMVGADLPPAVRRFAAAYERARNGGGVMVQVVPAGGSDVAGEHRVIVAPVDHVVTVPRVQGDHLILRNVRLPEQVQASSRPLPEGQWEVILSAGDAVLLAADQEHHRVWVGTELPEESPELVVLWTNIVEFAGGGVPEQCIPARKLDASWRRAGGALPPEVNGLRAGVYERAGEKLAVCVPAPVLMPHATGQNGAAEARLRAMAQQASEVPVGPYLWTLAGVLIVGAVAMGMARLR